MLKKRYALNRACVSRAGLFASCMAGAVLVVISVLLSAPNAVAQSTTVEFNIPAQPISSALRAYAHQAKVQLLVLTEGLEAIHANAVVGHLEPRTALQMLLAGTGLQAEYRPDATVAVKRGSDTAGPVTSASGDARHGQASLLGQARPEGAEAVMMAQAMVDENQTSRRAATDIGKGGKNRPFDEIIVTGTNIRGIAPESSPVRTFTREDIQISGAATAQDFIQTLSQNFGGGADESFIGAPGNQQAGSNVSIGSGVNLRGLGAGSTLVLLNGRRVAPSSDIGGFVDISMIPASAIERVEVLTDGASSIYGGDAVAGVINFVLRDEYDGVETSLRYGTVTEGDLDEYRASLTGGKNWGSGNGLIVYEYYKRDNLDNNERAFSKDFLSPNDLLPRQERDTVIGSLSQQLAPDLKFGADILFSQRKPKRMRTILGGAREGLTTETNLSTENLTAGTNLAWDVARDWVIDISGNYSKVSTDTDNFRTDGLTFSNHSDADYWAIETKASGTVIELPGGGAKLAVGGHYRQETFLNSSSLSGTLRDGDREVFAFFGEAFLPIVGPDNAFPGVHRLEINASGRFEDYSDFGSKANPKVGLLWAPTERLRLRGSYSTSFKPPTIGQTGALDRRATAVPTSFIFSIFSNSGATPVDPSIADVVLLNVTGTAANLDAETSRAVTGGFDYDIDSGKHSISLSSTYFDIEFTDRLGDTPIPEAQSSLLAFNIAFDSPELFPEGTVVFFPTFDELDAVLGSLVEPAREFRGADPLDTVIISFANVTRNLGRTKVRGVDLNATYKFDGDIGSLILGIAGTYLIDFAEQAAVTTPVVQLLDTQFSPLNLKLRGRLGYSRNGVNANLFINYADDYRVDNTDSAAPIESWTTVDLSLSYDTEKRYGSPLLDNTVFRLSVINLFDEDPPAAPAHLSNRLLGFDPTNASPLGRFVAFQIAKQF